jgi:hypothetical protein
LGLSFGIFSHFFTSSPFIIWIPPNCNDEALFRLTGAYRYFYYIIPQLLVYSCKKYNFRQLFLRAPCKRIGLPGAAPQPFSGWAESGGQHSVQPFSKEINGPL